MSLDKFFPISRPQLPNRQSGGSFGSNTLHLGRTNGVSTMVAPWEASLWKVGWGDPAVPGGHPSQSGVAVSCPLAAGVGAGGVKATEQGRTSHPIRSFFRSVLPFVLRDLLGLLGLGKPMRWAGSHAACCGERTELLQLALSSLGQET